VTAKHCLTDGNAAVVDDDRTLEFAGGKRTLKEGTPFFAPTDGQDLAIARISPAVSVPPEALPAPTFVDPLDSAIEQPFALLAYGPQGRGIESGQFTRGTFTVIEIVTTTVRSTTAAETQNQDLLVKGFKIEGTGHPRPATCAGDSGSPLDSPDHKQLHGVLSGAWIADSTNLAPFEQFGCVRELGASEALPAAASTPGTGCLRPTERFISLASGACFDETSRLLWVTNWTGDLGDIVTESQKATGVALSSAWTVGQATCTRLNNDDVAFNGVALKGATSWRLPKGSEVDGVRLANLGLSDLKLHPLFSPFGGSYIWTSDQGSFPNTRQIVSIADGDVDERFIDNPKSDCDRVRYGLVQPLTTAKSWFEATLANPGVGTCPEGAPPGSNSP
jgi:hypothetical protein